MSPELIHRFRKQAEFAAGYAPLYAYLFGLVADWLEAENAVDDELVQWLLHAADGRQPLDVTLLLMSGIHQKVLAGDESVHELAQFYPTNLTFLPLLPPAPPLPTLFRSAVLTHRNFLQQWIQTGFVQTNETARGSVWLLPLAYLPWSAVELLDLGASAGLNLTAEQRHYRLFNDAGQHLLDLGRGAAPQFTLQCSGQLPIPTPTALPTIIARTGTDIAPFHIHSSADELRLMSFVWADQPERLARLQEGLMAFQQIQHSKAPVTLDAVRLPDELPAFLDELPASTAPLIIYNTYITQYFKETADELTHTIGRWAITQPRPVLWLQWELFRDARQRQAPELGWCAWTADLWDNGNGTHHQWQLGWVHPHGTRAIFGEGLAAFAARW